MNIPDQTSKSRRIQRSPTSSKELFSSRQPIIPQNGVPIQSMSISSESPSKNQRRGNFRGRERIEKSSIPKRFFNMKEQSIKKSRKDEQEDSFSDDEEILPTTYKFKHDPSLIQEELIIPETIQSIKPIVTNVENISFTTGFPITISSDLINILQMISKMDEKMPVIAVQSPTGTGKSIGIPWIIIKHNPNFKIMVSVPTRAAALSLYKSMQIYDPEIIVGYAADREIRYDTNTQIIYATSGHVENLLYRNIKNGVCGNINFCDVLMIDEIHLGTISNDIIYSLWEYCAKSTNEDNFIKKYPRVILSSAFINEEKFPGIAKYIVSSRSYPIETIYYGRNPHPNNIYSDMVEMINEYHLQEPIENHFLVFAPGMKEINSTVDMLESLDLENVEIIPAYANLETSDIEKIYENYPGKRKIVVATNIAETAITIEGVGMVFDSLMEKRAETSAIGSLRLVTDFIPRTSSDQRRGRTGRTKPGKYFVMCNEEKYLSLISTRRDEIERVPLTDTIMSLITVGLDPSLIIKKLTEERKTYTINELLRLKLIIKEDDKYYVTEKGRFIDKFDLSVYTSSTLYDVLHREIVENKTIDNINNVASSSINDNVVSSTDKQTYNVLHIAALLTLIDTYDPPYFRFKNPPKGFEGDIKEFKAEHKKKYFEKYRGATDIHVLCNIWNDLMDFSGGYDKLNEKKGLKILNDWCNINSMNYRQVKEMLKKLKQVLFILGKVNGNFTKKFTIDYVILTDLQNSKIGWKEDNINVTSFSTPELYEKYLKDKNVENISIFINKIRDIMSINYSEFEMKMIGIHNTKYARISENNIYFIDTMNTVNNLMLYYPKYIIVLGSSESIDKLGREFRFITLSLNVDFSHKENALREKKLQEEKLRLQEEQRLIKLREEIKLQEELKLKEESHQKSDSDEDSEDEKIREMWRWLKE